MDRKTQLALDFDNLVYKYRSLSIHCRINWKSWNVMSDNWPDIYYTIKNAQYQIEMWEPKKPLDSREFQTVAPLAYPDKYCKLNYHCRHDY